MPGSDDQLDLKLFFPYQFSILAQQMSEFIALIYKKYGLSKSQWRVVATIGQHGEISARDICLFTRLEKMPVSRSISKLIDDELLAQRISESDRRTNLLTLTDKGQVLYQEIIPLVKSQEQQLLNGLTIDERDQFKAITLKLSAQLEANNRT